jgi:hypothetical protein
MTTLLLPSPPVKPEVVRVRRPARPREVRPVPQRRVDVLRGLGAAGDFVLGCVLGIIGVAVQLAPFAIAMVAFPFLPFLLPLSLVPVVVLFGLLILGAGHLLAALGLAPPPP